MSKNKIVPLALVTMLLWGSLFPIVKLGFTAYRVESTADILLFAGLRFVICGLIICLFAAFKEKSSYRAALGSLPMVLLSGLFAVTLHYGFTYVGLEMTDSSKTALLKQVGVLIYVCFSFVFIKEDKPTAKKIIAAVMGFAGIAALNANSGGFSFSVGDVLILCASFCTVFANVISKKVFEKVSPITATGVSQLFSGALLTVIGAAFGGKVRFALDGSLWIMAYICAASVVSYCIWYGIVKKGELSKLFIIKFAEPVFAALFGALLLNENIFNWQYLAAFILIFGGILISNNAFKIGRKRD